MKLSDWIFSNKFQYGVTGNLRSIKKVLYNSDCDVDCSYMIVGVFSVPKNYCTHHGKFEGEVMDVVLTANAVEEKDGTSKINYSCQCACGAWCTGGHSTPGAAVDQYVRMCERAKWEEHMIEKYGKDWDINDYIEIDEEDLKARPKVW